MLGQTIDQYKIVRALKKDAIAETFLATHMQTGAHFLLKAISKQLLAQDGFKEQFIEDAVNLIKFDHPNVIPLTNILDENGMLYTVEEYPGGRDLGRMIREHKGSFPLPGYKVILADLLKGLGYAHGHHYVHRFLSPKFLQITPEGRARINGFGNVLPMVTEQYLGKTELVDVAAYFSPERFANPDTTDIRANIYSLGVVLFQMATGRMPFVGPAYDDFRDQHTKAALPNPTAYNPSLPGELVALITAATLKRPEERYQNTVECYRALIKVPDIVQPASSMASRAPVPPAPPAAEVIDDSQFGFDQINDGAVGGGVDESFDFGYDDVSGINQQMDPSLAEGFEEDTFSEGVDSGFETPGTDPAGSGGFSLDDTAPDAEPVQPGGFSGGMDGFGFAEDEHDGPFPDPQLSGEVEAAVDDHLNFGQGGFAEPGFDQADGGFDGDFDFGAANDDSFTFGAPPPAAAAPVSLDDTKSDSDSFDFGAAQPVGSADDSFDFGAATGADDFDFAAPSSPPGADQGFGFDEPAANEEADDPFGFGNASNSQSGDGGFGYGAAEPESADDSFDFGHGAGPAGGDDLDFGPPPGASPAGEIGFGQSSDGGFSDIGGDMDFGAGPVDASDSFDFGIMGTPAAEAGAPDADPGDFHFGTAAPTPQVDTSGSELSFNLGDTNPESNSNEFNFEAPPRSEVNNFLVDDDGDDPFGPPEPSLGGDPFDSRQASMADDPVDPFAAFAGEDDAFTPRPQAPAARMDSYADDDIEEEPFAAPPPPPPPPPPPQPPPPQQSTARKGLESSLAGIERDQRKAERQQKPKAKVVRRIDKKVLALTVGLAILVLVTGFVWVNNRQRNAMEAAFLDDIRNLAEQKLYDEALEKINERLHGPPSGKFEQRLAQLKDLITQGKETVANQIRTLMGRAHDYEESGEDLTNGKTDALGTYMEILALDSSHPEARNAAKRIKADQVAKAEGFQAASNDLAALKVLSGLAAADKGDRDLQAKYKGLQERLNKERVGELTAEIERAYAAKNYNDLLPLLEELNEIDANSKFAREMRRNVVAAFESVAQGQVSRKNYPEAETAYHNALRLDPKNEKILAALNDIKDYKLNSDIDRKLRELERAIKKTDFPAQFQLANELMELDPGNQTAISTLDRVDEEINRLRGEAEDQRKKGQFRPAAALYKEIYDINGSEEVRALWAKFVKWSPPPRMAFIPVGAFNRGDNNTLNARPFSRVQVSNFFLDQYEVTNAEFLKFVEARREWQPGRIDPQYHDGNYLKHWVDGQPTAEDLNLPVTFVSWYAAEAYAAFQGKRLPTEAEWEKAAAGGTNGQKYWWGDYSDAKKAVYEFYPEKRPAPVGSFPANSYEVHEILGNVNEWVQDTFDPKYYQRTKDARDPVNLEPGTEKVFRGGSFKSRGRDLMIFLRYSGDPRMCHATIGFRCAQDARGADE